MIREVARAQPDIVFSTVVGEATAHLYQAYCEAGLNPATMPLASLTTTESEIRLMGAEVGCGHYTSAPYFERVDTGENASFVARYKKRFGADEPTNMCVEAAYFQIHVFARALAEIDAMNTDLMRMLVLGSEFDAPQGVISIDPETNHTQLWTRIGRAGRDGQFEIVLEIPGSLQTGPLPHLCAIGARGAATTIGRKHPGRAPGKRAGPRPRSGLTACLSRQVRSG